MALLASGGDKPIASTLSVTYHIDDPRTAMAPPTITKNVFLVVLPDYTTPEAKEARKKFFPAHLESPMVKVPGFIGTWFSYPRTNAIRDSVAKRAQLTYTLFSQSMLRLHHSNSRNDGE